MNLPDWPRLLPSDSAPRFAVRERLEDFEVEEIPAYERSGEGGFLWLWIEKRDRTTLDVARDLGRLFGVPSSTVGSAGLKDRRAVARQWFSVPWPAEPEVPVELDGVSVLSRARHSNGLRIGHLRGNRFRLALRGLDASGAAEIERRVARLRSIGMPNYYGPQRFGLRGDNHESGRRILETGRPPTGDRPGGRLTRLFVSAFQSFLFNECLALRMPEIGTLWAGDLAQKHENGAVFRVIDPGLEQPRADTFEISPSGPIVGRRMPWPEGQAGEIERSVAARESVQESWFRGRRAGIRLQGERRPLRVPVPDLACEPLPDGAVRLSFTLPAGAYATALLRELGTGVEPQMGAQSGE